MKMKTEEELEMEEFEKELDKLIVEGKNLLLEIEDDESDTSVDDKQKCVLVLSFKNSAELVNEMIEQYSDLRDQIKSHILWLENELNLSKKEEIFKYFFIFFDNDENDITGYDIEGKETGLAIVMHEVIDDCYYETHETPFFQNLDDYIEYTAEERFRDNVKYDERHGKLAKFIKAESVVQYEILEWVKKHYEADRVRVRFYQKDDPIFHGVETSAILTDSRLQKQYIEYDEKFNRINVFTITKERG